ncbi:hypothetical protein DRJ48_04370 [Candidatus Woesearchaeota archaeon]|nr:hypothetical protein [Candidatus Woesearchaeota archaeon]RLE42038.1 MAG: hypothetical protein DRJ48_04370 [Candidatus Woesearchaeota archaeon]
MKERKRLSRREEFEILKLVLDKILLLGFAIVGYGAYLLYNTAGKQGFFVLLTGAIILLIFTVLLIKEYEIVE